MVEKIIGTVRPLKSVNAYESCFLVENQYKTEYFTLSNAIAKQPKNRMRVELEYLGGRISFLYFRGEKFYVSSAKNTLGCRKLTPEMQIKSLLTLPEVFQHRINFFKNYVPYFTEQKIYEEIAGCALAPLFLKELCPKRNELLTEKAIFGIDDLQPTEFLCVKHKIERIPREFALVMALAVRRAEKGILAMTGSELLQKLPDCNLLYMPLIGDLQNREAQPRRVLIETYLSNLKKS